jgi:hypothetical protein
MLSLEAIGVLGIVYCFFMYGTLRAIRAKETVRAQAKAELEPAAFGAREPAKASTPTKT